jgi:hypothetical protein
MYRYIKFIILFLILIFFFTNIGCEDPKKLPTKLEIEVNNLPITKLESFTKDLEIDVFFDNTPSMQGFVNPGISTAYCDTLFRVEDAILKCWPTSKINFYKFGNDIIRLEGRDYLRVVYPDFYNLETDKTNLKTEIDKVIAHNTDYEKIKDNENNTDDSQKSNKITPPDYENDLRIIVTDLFQDETDINLLVKQINDLILSKGKSIGIIGLKSEYDGIIYDLGIGNLRIKYSTKNENGIEQKGRYKPFYLIVIGNIQDVYYFYSTLWDITLNKKSPLKTVFLGNEYYPFFIVDKPSTTDNIDRLEMQELKKQTSLLYNTDLKDYVEQYSIPSSKASELLDCSIAAEHFIKLPTDSSVDIPINLNALSNFKSDYKNFFNVENLNIEVITKKEQSVQNIDNKDLVIENNYKVLKAQTDNSIDNAIEITNKSIDSDSIGIDFSINSEDLETGKIHQFIFELDMTEFRYPDPDEWSEGWSMTNEEIARLVEIKYSDKNDLNEPLELEDFPGSKTIYLDRFINNLKTNLNVTSYNAKIASYNFLIKKE